MSGARLTVIDWSMADAESTPSTKYLCERCFQAIPPKAERCPGCGRPVAQPQLLLYLVAAAGIVALVVMVWMTVSRP